MWKPKEGGMHLNYGNRWDDNHFIYFFTSWDLDLVKVKLNDRGDSGTYYDDGMSSNSWIEKSLLC